MNSRFSTIVLASLALVGLLIGLWWLGTQRAEPQTARPVAPLPATSEAVALPTPEAENDAIQTPASSAGGVAPVETAPDPISAAIAPRPSRPVVRLVAEPGADVTAPGRIGGRSALSSTASLDFGPAVSSDGRLVLFTVEGDERRIDLSDQVILVDRQSGESELISVGPNGEAGAAWSEGATISADGRTVAFYSWAGNLVEGDTNAIRDLFVRDLDRGVTQRVSVSADGRQANDRSGSGEPEARPSLSADGRYVAYFSVADNLVADDTNGVSDIFVHDRESGATTRVSPAGDGNESNGESAHPELSGDGRFVVFESSATNLLESGSTAALPPATPQIYLYDRETGDIALLSRSMLRSGGPGYANGPSYAPTISADGLTVAFVSEATDLTPADRNSVADIFVVDVSDDQVERVSVASSGAQANRASASAALSADGRRVAFVSSATNLVSGDINQEADLFVHDRQSRQTRRLLAGAGAAQLLPALSADGSTVIFVSGADNLVSMDGSGFANLYTVDVADPPVYSVSGRTVDAEGAPIADVQVRAGRQSTLSEPNGVYTLTNLLEGTYTLLPQKSGYSFDVARHIVTVGPGSEALSRDFIGLQDGSPPQPFLDLPLAYAGTSERFLQILLDVEEGGRINAWFDHAFPNQGKTGDVVLWNGRTYARERYNSDLGCYERRCYDGHGGTDFPYRDRNGTTPEQSGQVAIYPAAAGSVVDVVDSCTLGDSRCGGGFGNYVVVNHRNGYFTRYAHLAQVQVQVAETLSGRLPLGVMGSTGRSSGTHLHFSVHRDDGNGLWDGGKQDLGVDPFGWSGIGVDPWVAEGGGPVSHWLWLHRLQRTTDFLGSQGTTLRSGSGDIQVDVPARAFQGQLQMELETGGTADGLDPNLRSAGGAFRVGILEWLDGGEQQRSAVESGAVDNVRPAVPLEISALLEESTVRHLDLSQLTFAVRGAGQTDWTPLGVELDPESGLATTSSSQLGDFVLAAPLHCPQDVMEPDDHTYLATTLSLGTPITRTLDIDADQDWFQLEVEAGSEYRWQVRSEGEVATELVLLDGDGIGELARSADTGSDLLWTAPRSGVIFARVTPTGPTGCEARYGVIVQLSE